MVMRFSVNRHHLFLKRLNLSSKKLVELLEDKVKTIESEGIVHFKINKNSAAFIYTYIPVLGVKLYKIILFDELTKK